MSNDLLETTDLGESAFLRAIHKTISATRFDPERGVVIFIWDDSDGTAAKALAQHRRGGVAVNSLDLTDGFYWIKNRVFECRRNGPERSGRAMTGGRMA